MPATAVAPSLMENAEFLAELETLEHRKPARPREVLDDRRLWERRLHHRAVFAEPNQAASGTAPARVSGVVSVLVTLMCALAGAGAAAFVFQERLAQILR